MCVCRCHEQISTTKIIRIMWLTTEITQRMMFFFAWKRFNWLFENLWNYRQRASFHALYTIHINYLLGKNKQIFVSFFFFSLGRSICLPHRSASYLRLWLWCINNCYDNSMQSLSIFHLNFLFFFFCIACRLYISSRISTITLTCKVQMQMQIQNKTKIENTKSNNSFPSIRVGKWECLPLLLLLLQ